MSVLPEKQPFIEHLEDLRDTLIKIAVTVSLCAVACFLYTKSLIIFYKKPLIHVLNQMNAQEHLPDILKSFTPTGAFMLSIKIALIGGFIVSLPLTLYFIAGFLLPALTRQERRMLLPVFLIGTLLFVLGCLFCYWICLPLSLKFLWLSNIRLEIIPLWTIESYISFVNLLLIGFGLAFEMPLMISVLIKLDFLTVAQLKSFRKHALVVSFILSAVLTPPDVSSQIILAIPLILLYELCIFFGRWIKKAPHANDSE